MRVVRGELFGGLKMALSNGPDKPFTAQDAAQRAYNNNMAAPVLGWGAIPAGDTGCNGSGTGTGWR